ncbi:putative mitochondrial protein AtMg01250 [Silene latifolia]|uniref:putative mitochondrial protein AtMg01250 n=1 Tax=Silene latifolia TaxID=37657 RepID=UPI003D77FD59
MQALNFPQKFIDLVMISVTSPTYSLNINGNKFGFFKGYRGLRQVDRLSPLLFTICMEYLSRILGVVATQDGFRFHPLCGHLRLNHLLFADDLLLFCKGTAPSIMWILRAFATFSSASGLCLNRTKSEIYFNGVNSGTVDDILQVSGFHRGSLPLKYLGVPISSKKLTKTESQKLTDRIVARIRG